MLSRARGAVLLLCLLAGSAEAQIYRWEGEGKRPWSISAGIGLIRRETGAWQPIHLAFDSAGWDHAYPACTSGLTCPPADHIVEDRPLVPVLTVRRLITGRLQGRAFITSGSPGKYPGLNGVTQIHVRPSIFTVGVQAVGTLGPFFGALGPTLYRGVVNIKGNTVDETTTGSGVGLGLTIGVAVPKKSPFFFELLYERHYAGTLHTAEIPMTGAPNIPPLDVPLSHTVFSIGLGYRL